MSRDVAVGMMDKAYFVGRGELLDFFNCLLDLQLTKIEQTASGAIACQLTEYIFPGSIPMSRVNWEAKSDFEFVANYKLLQSAFNKHKIQRYVDVDKLIRAKYQDNLEFCQWLKAFYDQSGAIRDDYNPAAVRARGKGGKKYNDFLQKTASKHGSKPLPAARNNRTTISRNATTASPRTTTTRPSPAKTTKPRVPIASRAAPSHTRTTGANNRTKTPLGSTENKKLPTSVQAKVQKATADAELVKRNQEMKAKMEEMETSLIEIEKERDFYFGKLRNVELMLQVNQDKNFEGTDLETVVGSIFKVLYATAEEDVAVSDAGEIVPAAGAQEYSELEVSQMEASAAADESAVMDNTPVKTNNISVDDVDDSAFLPPDIKSAVETPEMDPIAAVTIDEPDEF